MVSAVPPQPLMATTSSSKKDMLGPPIQTIRPELEKVHFRQVKTHRIHVIVVPTVASFVLIIQDRTVKVQLKTKTRIKEINKAQVTPEDSSIVTKTRDASTATTIKTTNTR